MLTSLVADASYWFRQWTGKWFGELGALGHTVKLHFFDFYFLCMSVLPSCMPASLSRLVTMGNRRGLLQIPWDGVMSSCETQSRCWESNPSLSSNNNPPYTHTDTDTDHTHTHTHTYCIYTHTDTFYFKKGILCSVNRSSPVPVLRLQKYHDTWHYYTDFILFFYNTHQGRTENWPWLVGRHLDNLTCF